MSKLQEYLEMAKPKRASKFQMYREIIKETASGIRESGNVNNNAISDGVLSILSELKINNFDIIEFFKNSISETVKTMNDVKSEIEDELRYEIEQG